MYLQMMMFRSDSICLLLYIRFKNHGKIFAHLHCVPRVPVCEVYSRLYLFAYCLNPYKTMHFTRFSHRRNATYNLNRLKRVKRIVFCGFKQ